MPEPSARGFQASANIAFLKESATIAVSARAKALKAAGRAVIDLGAGEPDFETPEFIRRAANDAVEQGATHYTTTEGILPLREAIAAEATARLRGGAPVEAKDVVVSNGSKQSLFNACFALFGPGDEVLIPSPSWTSYYEMVALARATAVPVMGDPACGFRVTAQQLDSAATPRTRGVVLNSPCNPTGASYDAVSLKEIAALAQARGWWIITDEIYRRISYEGRAASLLELAADRDRLVIVDGVAKAYAMTGWRIGWAIAPRALSAAMVAEFRARRDAAAALLAAAPGVEFIRPQGAFYLFIRVAPDGTPGDAGTEFAKALLEKHDVAVVPGSAFLTPNWVRLSYAAPREQVLEGVRRTIALLSERRP